MKYLAAVIVMLVFSSSIAIANGLVDSDWDGVPDWDEENIYFTDANNSDTDGDGYLDGEEINAGYDPLGSGRLDLDND